MVSIFLKRYTSMFGIPVARLIFRVKLGGVDIWGDSHETCFSIIRDIGGF